MPNPTSSPPRASIASLAFSIASPETIRSWSSGEVEIGEILDNKQWKPIEKGLFCVSIFGSATDTSCKCGKLEGLKQLGKTCRRCGSRLPLFDERKERMGHIELASPVAHVWFLRHPPRLIPTALGMSWKKAVKVANFKAQLVINPRQTALILHQILEPDELEAAKETYGEAAFVAKPGAEGLHEALAQLDLTFEISRLQELLRRAKKTRPLVRVKKRLQLLTAFQSSGVRPEWLMLTIVPVLPPALRNWQIRYPKPNAKLNTDPAPDEVTDPDATAEIEQPSIEAPDYLRPRLQVPDVNFLYRKLIEANNRLKELIANGAEESDLCYAKRKLQFCADHLLDNAKSAYPASRIGARGKSNDSKVIARLQAAGIAAEVESRRVVDERFEDWLQPTQAQDSNQNRYRSLTDSLTGKVGRFRGNLLGKRVNFSGRTVIVAGPNLQLHQCGLPMRMALELFRPFIIGELNQSKNRLPSPKGQEPKVDYSAAIQSLKCLVEAGQREAVTTLRRMTRSDELAFATVWASIIANDYRKAVEVLATAVNRNGSSENGFSKGFEGNDRPAAIEALVAVLKRGHLVLINRAPTLHRHSIQAFEPVLVDGEAIQLHPLVCPGYNADFDGDTVAVHVPLSVEAQLEARLLMMAPLNLQNPASGKLALTPSQDIVLGCYYLTSDPAIGPPPLAGPLFGDCDQVRSALDRQDVRIHDRIRLANSAPGRLSHNGHLGASFVRTTVGRVLFNELLPAELGFVNEPIPKERLIQLIEECYHRCGRERAVKLLDGVKALGFQAATKSGISIGMADIVVPANKNETVEVTRKRVAKIEAQRCRGAIKETEKHELTEAAWHECMEKVQTEVLAGLEVDIGVQGHNPLWIMVDSKARGNRDQLQQLAGMRGLMLNSDGEAQRKPITSNFREGLTVEEFLISSNSVRKVQDEMEKVTPAAGYFTRKLVNFAHDVVIVVSDCHTEEGIVLEAQADKSELRRLRVARTFGRTAAEDVYSPTDASKLLVRAGREITRRIAQEIQDSDLQSVKVRSAFSCQTDGGICSACYGRNLATDATSQLGDAVGIIAAQSLGQPAIQLTLRLFHNGGTVKCNSIATAFDGSGVSTLSAASRTSLKNHSKDPNLDTARDEDSPADSQAGSGLHRLEKLLSLNKATKPPTDPTKRMKKTIPKALLARASGCVDFTYSDRGDTKLLVGDRSTGRWTEHSVGHEDRLLVNAGDQVEVGEQLTRGLVDLTELLALRGPQELLRFVNDTAQSIYAEDGVEVDGKHIEIIVRQMLSLVEVVDAGDTRFTPGSKIGKDTFKQENDRVCRLGGMAATGKLDASGIGAKESADSGPLSSAGFADPPKALSQAVALATVDNLDDLRSCIMTGKLIPAGTGFGAYRKIEPKATPDTTAGVNEAIR